MDSASELASPREAPPVRPPVGPKVPQWLKTILVTLGSIAVTLLGLLFITFIIGRVMPIDPVLAIVGERASQSTYDAAFLELGLDKPLVVQFLYYLWDVLHLDFGTSILNARPVIEDIARVFPATMELYIKVPGLIRLRVFWR